MVNEHLRPLWQLDWLSQLPQDQPCPALQVSTCVPAVLQSEEHLKGNLYKLKPLMTASLSSPASLVQWGPWARLAWMVGPLRLKRKGHPFKGMPGSLWEQDNFCRMQYNEWNEWIYEWNAKRSLRECSGQSGMGIWGGQHGYQEPECLGSKSERARRGKHYISS